MISALSKLPSYSKSSALQIYSFYLFVTSMKTGRRNLKWIAAGIAPTLLSVFAAILSAPQAGDVGSEMGGMVFWV